MTSLWTELVGAHHEIKTLRAEVEALRAALGAVQRYPGIAEYVGTQIMDMIKEAMK